MFEFFNTDSRLYTLASTNRKFKDKVCGSREVAKRIMFAFTDKKGLQLVEVWDDHHFKTYIFDDGSRFFINRV